MAKRNKEKENDLENFSTPFADILGCFMDGLKSSGKRRKNLQRKEKNYKWKKK